MIRDKRSVMETQEILLFLAKYIERGLDLETALFLDHELKDHPKGVLFLMNYRHTLLIYKRHLLDNENFGWIVEYLDKRIPESLNKLVEDLFHKEPLKLVRKKTSAP